MLKTHKIKRFDAIETEYFGKKVTVLLADDANMYVVFEDMCEMFSLDPKEELKRISDHVVLSRVMGEATVQGVPETYCIKTGYFVLWLLNIPQSKLGNSDRLQIESFQARAVSFLENAFREGALTSDEDIIEALINAPGSEEITAVNLYTEAMRMLYLAQRNLLEIASVMFGVDDEDDEDDENYESVMCLRCGFPLMEKKDVWEVNLHMFSCPHCEAENIIVEETQITSKDPLQDAHVAMLFGFSITNKTDNPVNMNDYRGRYVQYVEAEETAPAYTHITIWDKGDD